MTASLSASPPLGIDKGSQSVTRCASRISPTWVNFHERSMHRNGEGSCDM